MWWQYIDWVFYLIGFIFSVMLFWSSWKFWREERYKNSRKLIPWVFLEIKVPREVLKGPKAMEAFFQSIGKLANRPATLIKKYWDGEVTRYHIIDIIGRNNEVRFFMRVSYRLVDAVEGLLYANYPEIEITRCEDPFRGFPSTYKELHDRGYEIYGNELFQTKEPGISIRTYEEFEQETGDEKGRIIDPFSVLLELIGTLQPSEMILVQFVLVPDTHRHWQHGAKHMLETFRDTTQQIGTDKEGKPQYKFRFRTPGEEGVIKRLEDKLTMSNFETTIRYIYVSPKEIYNFNIGYRGIQTYFNQFRHDRQTLERNLYIMTKAEWYYFPWIFHNTRLFYRRMALWDEYIHRFIPEETLAGKIHNSYIPWKFCFRHKLIILSAEEMATLFHIPTNVVLTASSMERIESKRLAPPMQLPE